MTKLFERFSLRKNWKFRFFNRTFSEEQVWTGIYPEIFFSGSVENQEYPEERPQTVLALKIYAKAIQINFLSQQFIMHVKFFSHGGLTFVLAIILWNSDERWNDEVVNIKIIVRETNIWPKASKCVTKKYFEQVVAKRLWRTMNLTLWFLAQMSEAINMLCMYLNRAMDETSTMNLPKVLPGHWYS